MSPSVCSTVSSSGSEIDVSGPGSGSELLRRYLQTRRELREPEILLPDRDRRRAIAALRRLARALESGETDGPEVERGRTEAEERSRGDEPVSPSRRPSKRSKKREGLPPEPPLLEGEPALPGEEIARLREDATSEELGELADLVTLRAVADGCTRCPLHRDRTHVAFGEGSPRARVVCVGEAPGAVEDRTGRPFVGPAGQLLDRLLLSAGFHRHEVFICNVLKCRPPGNRDPRTEEIERCSPYLHRQLELVDPEVIVAFGTFAARTLLDVRESLGRMREQTHLYRGYPLVATYHPAALLRNPAWTRPTWEDLQRVRDILEGRSEVRPADSERLQVDAFELGE